jgi:hypothetical protein
MAAGIVRWLRVIPPVENLPAVELRLVAQMQGGATPWIHAAILAALRWCAWAATQPAGTIDPTTAAATATDDALADARLLRAVADEIARTTAEAGRPQLPPRILVRLAGAVVAVVRAEERQDR